MTYPPTYLGSGDPARRRTDYYPVWLNDLADDVTCEAAAMNGAAQGPEAVRRIVVTAKTLYEYQDINYAGPYGDNGFLEDYTTQVHGQPTGVVVTVARNAAGQTKHIVVNHRPRSSMLLVSRLLGEKFADTPQAGHFIGSEARNGYGTCMTYLGSGDPARHGHDYYPWWLDNLADDATGEGAFMEGAAQGAEAVREIVSAARTIYEYQEFSYHDDYGDNGFLENYTTRIQGEPAGVVVTVARNAAGQAQHVVVNHRPRSSLLLVARLMGEKFTGTPQAGLFIAPES